MLMAGWPPSTMPAEQVSVAGHMGNGESRAGGRTVPEWFPTGTAAAIQNTATAGAVMSTRAGLTIAAGTTMGAPIAATIITAMVIITIIRATTMARLTTDGRITRGRHRWLIPGGGMGAHGTSLMDIISRHTPFTRRPLSG